jgi:drug/metabolite transporter (DMT)-like permease
MRLLWDAMIAVLLGLFAALCWAVHDTLARRHAPGVGSSLMAVWVLLVGAALLVLPVLQSGALWKADAASFAYAGAMGVAYAFGIGGLFKAFSLAPMSVVGPFTSSYPALVVVWGVINGLAPSPVEWIAFALVLAGGVVVARAGHPDGGINAVAPGKLKVVVIACAFASLGYAASIVLGQRAALGLGEFETTFASRFPAALLLLPLAGQEPARQTRIPSNAWLGIFLMALFDVLAASSINYAGRFPNKEFAGMGISAYGGLAVLLAVIFLKERVSAGQWVGILLTATGIGLLAWPR